MPFNGVMFPDVQCIVRIDTCPRALEDEETGMLPCSGGRSTV